MTAVTARNPALARMNVKVATALFVAIALVPPVAHLVGHPFLTVVAIRMLVFAIAALSLDLILGYGALVSFGHAAFLGIGAYSVAILSRAGVTDVFAHVAVGALAAGVFAAVTGAISLRTRGVYFIMITLAFSQIAFFFFVSLSSYGGDDGVALAARSTVFGMPLLASDVGLFYGTLALLVVAFIVLQRVVASRFGRVLIGTRESMLRIQAIGISPFRFQLTAYVMSGCLCAVAGVMLANQAAYVSPSYMSWQRSGELIIMLVLGGIGTLTGAIGGAFLTVALEEGLARFSEHWRLGFGLVLVLVVLFSPDGLTGLARRLGITGKGNG